MYKSTLIALSLVLLTPSLSHAQRSSGGKGITTKRPACASYTRFDFHGAEIGFGQYCDGKGNPTTLEMQVTYKGGFVHVLNEDPSLPKDIADLPENGPYGTEEALLQRWSKGLSAADKIRLERVLLPALECGDGPVIRQAMQDLIRAPWDEPTREVKLMRNRCEFKSGSMEIGGQTYENVRIGSLHTGY